MNKTAIIMSKEEALALPPARRPICYRLPSKIYHDVFEAVGAASMCWDPRPTREVFSTDEATKVAVDLCFKIAAELERLGITYEQICADAGLDSVADSDKNRSNAKPAQPAGGVAHPLGVEPKTF